MNKILMALCLVGLISCGSTEKKEEKIEKTTIASIPPINVYCSPAPATVPKTATGTK